MPQDLRDALRRSPDADSFFKALDAQNRQNLKAISGLYRENNIIGFGTYGEQYRSMHLNQTFTGIAFAPGPMAAE